MKKLHRIHNTEDTKLVFKDIVERYYVGKLPVEDEDVNELKESDIVVVSNMR